MEDPWERTLKDPWGPTHNNIWGLTIEELLGLTVEGPLGPTFEDLGLRITLEVCNQDLPYSLDTTKNISIKEVPQVVIRDASCTWHDLQ